VRWSYRIGRVAGIGIYVHATFLILLVWYGLAAYRERGTVAAAVAGVLFILAVFAVVVLHELGHALTAARYGIPTRDITLLPIGGVARLERMPREPRQELLIALAGPAVNVVLALLLYVLLAATGGVRSALELDTVGGASGVRPFLAQLLSVNIWLALFNLIPAFPMDGGRVLRALLAMRSGNYARATEQAASLGRLFALLFAVLGLFVVHNPFLVFIALFVWLGAAGEAATVQTSSSLEGVPLDRLMITDVRTLSPSDPLSRAVQHILAGFQQDFPVVDDTGRVAGVLTRTDLMRSLAERGAESLVGDAMHRDFQTADPTEPVEHALARLRSCGCNVLPVVRGRELLGVLTMDNVGEYVMVQSALRGVRA
jgi:Zn-dependent protease/predicted transcriptional regulator